MDKTEFSPAQGIIVETLPGPLFVAAGAGSGKTYTLKLRTANAFLENESGFKLDSIDQVLAITFTNAAAEELLSRIKDTLLKEGLKDQAFDADTAWISTIHGFCARLLRENALELGLDPEFHLLTELETTELRQVAQRHVLKLMDEGQIQRDRMLVEWNLFPKGKFDEGLMEVASRILDSFNALPDGPEAFHHLDLFQQPAELIRDLVALAQGIIDDASTWDKANSRSDGPALKKLTGAVEKATPWLQSEQAHLTFDDEGLDLDRFRETVEAFPALTEKFLANHEGDPCVERYLRAWARAVYEAAARFGAETAEVAFQIAKAENEEFTRLKREAGGLDNGDLLRMALEALRRDDGALAERYRQQFKLIMIDEFQDTDRIQIEILRLIAQPGLANVCVVGDAQQSIYRFRGADVNAFMEYRDALEALHPSADPAQLRPELDWNFRSHKDILSFVDSIFSQADSFGDEYLQLEARGGINKEADPVMDERARIQVGVLHHPSESGVSKDQALQLSVQRIAQHFADLKRAYEDAGVAKLQTFALLLGSTTNAPVYIQALREVGLESMMTAGSILMSSDEAAVLTALLRYGLNTQDEQPLLDCLTSPLFAISDDALLGLAYAKQDDGVWHVGLSQGFQSSDLAAWGLSAQTEQSVQIAREVLGAFVRRVREGRPSEAVRQALVESGYLDRMQRAGVSGLASVGNYSKLLDILQGVERDQVGLAEVIAGFEAKLDQAKASPGVLMVEGAEVVQIMTIHGSKGLQFDHVAVAEFKNGAGKAPSMPIENEGQRTFALTGKGFKLTDARKPMEAALAAKGAASLHDAETPGELLALLGQTSQRESMGEARRLLYVALTRAVKSLFVSYGTTKGLDPEKEPYADEGIFREVYEALDWDVTRGEEPQPQACGYGGTRPALVHFQVPGAQQGSAGAGEEGADPAAEDEPFLVSVRTPVEMPFQMPFAGARANVCSYSSLSHDEPAGLDAGDVLPVMDGEEASEGHVLEHEVGEDPTALGSTFHRLAQLAIMVRGASGGGALQMPAPETVNAQKEKLGVSSSQGERLDQALQFWFGSNLAQELCAYDSLEAEVPFMVRLESAEGKPLFLEGEIDALATSGNAAFLVDYKTGGSPQESMEQIRVKHQLQAQCYAYALLRVGYELVKATFVRVEQEQSVTYEFTASDLASLEQEILSRWSS